MAKIEWKHIACVLAAIIAVIIQINSGSMPLGAVDAIITLLVTGAMPLKNFDAIAMEGIASMSYVGIVLMAASGFANVTREAGHIDSLIAAFTSIIGGNKLIGAMAILFLGLLVTMGIGSAWSTIPIVASIMVPMGITLGFSPSAIILLVSASAALGDSGSPSSDQTLVPTAAFNMDGQHDHIRDTCIPPHFFHQRSVAGDHHNRRLFNVAAYASSIQAPIFPHARMWDGILRFAPI